MGRWGGTGRSRGIENCNQNTLREKKSVFNFKRKGKEKSGSIFNKQNPNRQKNKKPKKETKQVKPQC